MIDVSDSTSTIKVSESAWKRLNSRKEPGDTFNDVIEGLLDDYGDAEIEN